MNTRVCRPDGSEITEVTAADTDAGTLTLHRFAHGEAAFFDLTGNPFDLVDIPSGKTIASYRP